MITALIFAGGTGQRMNARAKPKQFLELHGKPMILYTIEHFEKHHQIDNIIVVCLESWIEELRLQLSRYSVKKQVWIISGGGTAHQSIFNGLAFLKKKCQAEDIVLIHDGVRPLIDGELITKCVEKASQCGTAVTVAPAVESVARVTNGETIDDIPMRNIMFLVKAPQAFRFELVWEVYCRAEKEHIVSIDTAHLFSLFGYELHTVYSSNYNVKITSPSDYFIFRALYEAIENSQIFGL